MIRFITNLIISLLFDVIPYLIFKIVVEAVVTLWKVITLILFLPIKIISFVFNRKKVKSEVVK